MTERKPVSRIEFYDKNEKRRYRVATVWPGRTEFSDDVVFERETNATKQYPTMTIADAQARSDAKEGFIQISKAKAQKQEPKLADPTDDTEIPF